MRNSTAIALFIALIALTAGIAGAGPVSFQVDPMAIETTAQPGDQQTGSITVTNTTASDPAAPAQPLRLRIYALDWTMSRDGLPVFSRPGTLTDSCSNWLQINPVEVDIAPGQATQVRYTTKVPAGVAGCYRCMIMFETTTDPTLAGHRTLAVNGRIGSALYIQVGPAVKRLRVNSFDVSPAKTNLTVENTGNIHVRLKGVVQYADASGAQVQQLKLPGAVVLAGDTNNQRDFSVDTPKLPSGGYTVTAVIDYGADTLVGARTHVTIP